MLLLPAPGHALNDMDIAALGGIATGRDVTNSNISIGIPPDQLPGIIAAAADPLKRLTDEQKATIGALERRLGANEVQLLTFFQIIGEAGVAPERMGAKLVEVAQRYQGLQAQLAAVSSGDPMIDRRKTEAKAALERGELDRADALLVEVQGLQDAAADRLALEAAATRAQRAEVAGTRLRYDEAAKLFAEAARRVPPGHEEQRLGYLEQEAGVLFLQGNEWGDTAALVAAIDRQRTLLRLRPRAHDALAWARNQVSLGLNLTMFGILEQKTARLEEAVAALHLALEELTRERDPVVWAAIQMLLGNALVMMPGTARLEEAVAAFHLALEEFTRERDPAAWAMAQMALGYTLLKRGWQEAGTARREEALATYRLVLEASTRERDPVVWATAQMVVGMTLVSLGEREPGTARLEQAVAALHLASEELTRERFPLQWANVQLQLSNALTVLGEREPGTARLEQAVATLHLALEELTRERGPVFWAMAQHVLGYELRMLGEREPGTARLEQALATLHLALEELTREHDPFAWAEVQLSLGNALTALGEREPGTARLEQALATLHLALEELTRERRPFGWAEVQLSLGNALTALGEREPGTARLEQAVVAYETALAVFEAAGAGHYLEITQQKLGRVEEVLRARRARG
jgi:tetratricopeptide (TPR) repeat protein